MTLFVHILESFFGARIKAKILKSLHAPRSFFMHIHSVSASGSGSVISLSKVIAFVQYSHLSSKENWKLVINAITLSHPFKDLSMYLNPD